MGPPSYCCSCSFLSQRPLRTPMVTKGADNIMEALLDKPMSRGYKDRLYEYSAAGLRTLLVAYRRFDGTRSFEN